MKIWINTNSGNQYIKKLMSDENIERLKKADPNLDRLTLLSMGNSAIRPAGDSYRDDLANGIVRRTGSPAIDEFLAPTFGYLVFQCQIIEFLHKYCGYTMGEADIIRRGFAKKTGTEQYIPHIKAGFIKTMTEKYGSTVEKAEEDIVEFIKVIEDASRYLFSLNHSQPYTFEAYVEGYLRYYYPFEFITEALNLNKDKEEKTIALINYAKKVGIKILPPKFRHSKSNYMHDKSTNSIYKGIESITYMNKTVAEELYYVRDKQYDSFIELLIDIKDMKIDSRQLDILVKLNFFSEFGHVNMLLKQVELFNAIYGKKQFKRPLIDIPQVADKQLIPPYIAEMFADKITEKQYRFVDTKPMLEYLVGHYKYKETSLDDLLKYESELLGYIQYSDSRYKDDVYYITDIDKNRVHLHNLNNGIDTVIKFRKGGQYKRDPFVAGDIIKVIKIEPEPKFVKGEDGEWTRDYNNYEDILQSWIIKSGGDK